jgi:ribosome maturation factor RimP
MVDEERIRSVITPVVEGLGMRVVRVAWGRQGRSRNLRIDVDRYSHGPVPVPYRGSRMTADDLGGVTREISAVLDAYGVVDGSYVLEVSTPGLDRALVSEQDFRDFTGHPVRIVLERMTDGQRRIQGTIGGIEGEGRDARLLVTDSGVTTEVKLENIQAANLRVVVDGFGHHHRPKAKRGKRRNSR